MSAAARMARQGRGGDTMLGHLTPGEVVVPPPVLAQMGTTEQLRRGFAAAGLDMGRYTVGGGDDSRNPRTGVREYQVGSSAGPGGPGGAASTGPEGSGMGGDDGDGGGDDFGMFDDPSMQPDVDADAAIDAAVAGDFGDASPVAQPVQDKADLVRQHEVPDILPAGTYSHDDTKSFVESQAEAFGYDAIGIGDLIGAAIAPGGLMALGKQHMDNQEALAQAAEKMGLSPDTVSTIMSAQERGPAHGEEGADTLPGDAGAPETEPEPEDAGPAPDSPEAVFADVTPWEGVPESTQATLPEGWLGQAQAGILAAHQSAERMGAW